jgi:hypothetical protein
MPSPCQISSQAKANAFAEEPTMLLHALEDNVQPTPALRRHFGRKPFQAKKTGLTIPVWTAGARRPFATPVWAQTATAAQMPCLTMAKWKTDRVAITYDVSAVTHPQRPEQKPKHHPSARNVTMRAWLFGHKIRRQLGRQPRIPTTPVWSKVRSEKNP